jgi:hypothetical protein
MDHTAGSIFMEGQAIFASFKILMEASGDKFRIAGACIMGSTAPFRRTYATAPIGLKRLHLTPCCGFRSCVGLAGPVVTMED